MTEYSDLIDNEQDLDKILETNKRVYVLLYATWCPFCVRFLPVFERMRTRYSQNDSALFLLVQDNQEIIADKYEVTVIPTVLFFEKGVVCKRLDGKLGIGLTERDLAEFVRECNIQSS